LRGVFFPVRSTALLVSENIYIYTRDIHFCVYDIYASGFVSILLYLNRFLEFEVFYIRLPQGQAREILSYKKMHIFSLSSSSAAAAAMLLLLSSPVLTLPQPQPTDGEITVQQLLQISPTSESCDGAVHPDECATAAQAVPFINAEFAKYNISSTTEKAALISLMVSESGDFKNNIKHDAVGQGSKSSFSSLCFSSRHNSSKSLIPFSNASTEYANVRIQQGIREHVSPAPVPCV
jgi:hypothetical protein